MLTDVACGLQKRLRRHIWHRLQVVQDACQTVARHTQSSQARLKDDIRDAGKASSDLKREENVVSATCHNATKCHLVHVSKISLERMDGWLDADYATGISLSDTLRRLES
jgi:hypothetical protein